MSKFRPQRGVTLIELLITVAIVAILASLAAPSFRDSLIRNRLSGYNSDFITAINFARSESIKRGQTVTICRSSDGSSCAANGGWEQGWIVFTDNDGDGTVDTSAPPVASDDQILRVWPALADGYTLRSAALPDNIRYNARGLAALSGDFILCQANTLVGAKAVVISTTRPRVATNGTDSIPDTDAGANFNQCIPAT